LDALWIKYNQEKCDYDKLPEGKWLYLMGVDLGHDDADALAILAYSDASPVTYLVEEMVTVKQGITELVDQVQQSRHARNIVKIVCDEGALGKKIAEEIRRRH